MLLGFASLAAIVVADQSSANYKPILPEAINALDYNVIGDGTTNDATTLQTFLTNASTQGVVAFIPGGKTYNLGSSSLTVADNLQVLCGRGATLKRSADPSGATPYGVYTSAMISLGNYVKWSGGILTNTAVLATSTSSNTMGTGASKTFTIQTGLTLTSSSFLRIYSRANPANHYEGLVNSYNSGTGALDFNAQFSNGSGTFTDWDVCHAGIYQCPMVLHSVTETVVEDVRVTGKWYVGMLMDGWNLTPSTALQVNKCTFRACYAESVQNRGFYIYGNSDACVMENCFVLGGSSTTDYGFNFNPANATGTVNNQLRTRILNCHVESVGYQGFAISDLCFYNIITGCTVNSVTNAAGVGFLMQLANAQIPQYNSIVGCIATGCAGIAGFAMLGTFYSSMSSCRAVSCNVGFNIAPSSATQPLHCSINSSEAISSTTIGFRVQGNASRCDLNDIKAVNNTTNGVQIDAGAVRTLVTGRSFNNTSANLSDGGTSSVTTGLTVA